MKQYDLNCNKIKIYCSYFFIFFIILGLSPLQAQSGSGTLYDDNLDYEEEYLEEEVVPTDRSKVKAKGAKVLDEGGVATKNKDTPQDLDQILKNLEAKNNDLLKKAQALVESGELTPMKLLDTVRKSDSFKESNDRSKLIKETLKPFRQMKEEELKETILANTKNSFFGNKLKENPLLLSFIVNLLKDEKAIPMFITISEKKFLGMVYLIFIILSFFLAYWLKKRAIRKNLGFLKGFLSSVKRIFFFMVLRIGVFIFIFYEQLSPLGQQVKNTFFKDLF